MALSSIQATLRKAIHSCFGIWGRQATFLAENTQIGTHAGGISEWFIPE